MTDILSPRVAALYDIHGNLPALEAVLEAVKAEGVDMVVVGGDIVAGPMPRQTIERLMAFDLPILYIRGNADREVVMAFDGDDLSEFPPSIQTTACWTAQQLDCTHRDFLATMPATVVLTIPSLGPTLFCHATPQDDTTIITRLSPDIFVQPLLARTAESLVVCGHTHMPFVRHIGSKQLINAGSVGMAYGITGAWWAQLGPLVRIMQVSYDTKQAAAQVRATTYPEADEFVQNMLQPANETEVTAFFEQLAATQRAKQHR